VAPIAASTSLKEAGRELFRKQFDDSAGPVQSNDAQSIAAILRNEPVGDPTCGAVHASGRVGVAGRRRALRLRRSDVRRERPNDLAFAVWDVAVAVSVATASLLSRGPSRRVKRSAEP